jgi:hypothetical protein
MRRATFLTLGAVLILAAALAGSLGGLGRSEHVLGADENEMAVDADASTAGFVDASATYQVGTEFDVGINVTAASVEWQAWDAQPQWDLSLLEYVPTSDVNYDTVNESWAYTGLGGTLLNAAVGWHDDDLDTSVDSLYGGSARIVGPIAATGQAAVVRFRSLDAGVSPIHLIPTDEPVPAFGSGTLAPGGGRIATVLVDAEVTCSVDPPPTGTPSPTPAFDPTPTPDPDIDRDGIPNASDNCPDSPEDEDWFEDADGCPDPDNDGDGICDLWLTPSLPVCDGVDWCPEAPEDHDGFMDSDGCPDIEGNDQDGDGLENQAEISTYATDPAIPDTDLDGCSDGEEVAMGSSFDATSAGWYDVYDVPVPARPEPTQNGARNGVVDMGDVLGVLFYAFTDEGGPPNGDGVRYDSDKNGDTTPDGRDYDRSPGAGPDPVTGIDPAGEPNGSIDIGDVLGALAQAFVVDCSGPP